MGDKSSSTIDGPTSTGPMRAIVFVSMIVFAMGQSILFALAGPVAREIGLVEWQVGAIVSAAAVVFVIVSPFWGRLADRLGRKTVMVSGLVGYGLTTLVFAVVLLMGLQGVIGASLAFAILLGTRLLYAVTSGGIQPAAVAMMADATSEHDRSVGVALVGAGFGLGTVLGPTLAAALVLLGVLSPLFVAAGLAFAIALIALLFLDEPQRKVPSEAGLASAFDIKGNAPYLLLAFGTFVAVSALQQTAAFYVQDFTETDAARAAQLAGFAFIALALATLIVQGGVVQVLKPSPILMLGIGFPLMALGVLAYLLAPSFAWIIIAFLAMGAGFGLVQPGITAFVSLQTSADAQGGAAGFVQAAMAGGFVVGPLAGTIIYGISPSAPLLLALGSLVACLAIFTFLARLPTRAV